MATVNDIVNQDLSAYAPDYENNIRSKMTGFNVVFSFPNCPVESEKTVAFPAYVKKVDDNFNPKFDSRQVYGRMDPIPIYQGTTRTIGFDLAIPSNGLAHSIELANKLNILVKNTYPTYQKNGSVNIIASPPLVSVFFSNLIYDKVFNGPMLGYFQSGIKIQHDLDKGVFARKDGYEVYPKAYNLTFILNILHRYTPGYQTVAGIVTNPVSILKGY